MSTTVVVGSNPTRDLPGSQTTALSSFAPTTPQNTSGSLPLGYYDGSIFLHGMLAFRGLGALTPPGPVTVTQADIQVTVKSGSTGNETLVAYECLRAWDETTATWNEYDTSLAWGTAGGTGAADKGSTAMFSVNPGPSYGGGNQVYNLIGGSAFKQLVEDWINGVKVNNGLIWIRTDGPDSEYIECWSKQGAFGDLLTPALTVTYTAQGGSVTETLSASDTSNRTLSATVSRTEALTAAETSSASTSNLVGTETESGSAADTESAVLGFAASVAESDPATDASWSTKTGQTDSVTDSLNLVDAESSTASNTASVAESGTAASTQDAIVGKFSVEAESAPLTDETHYPPFVPGVAAVTEALSAIDTPAVSSLSAAASDVETLAAVDAPFVAIGYSVVRPESDPVSDTSNRVPGYGAEVDEESFLLNDNPSATVASPASVVESLAATDTQSAPFGAILARAEALAAADVSSIVGGQTASRSEILFLVNNQSAVASFGTRAVAEILNAVDHPVTFGAVAASAADILSLIDTSNRQPSFNRAVNEIAAIAELIGVSSQSFLAAAIEALAAVDHPQASFLVFRSQVENANAVDVSSAANVVHYIAVDLEALAAVDTINVATGKLAEDDETLQAVDRQTLLDVSGFKLGNPERITVEYRRRVWVISNTRQG